MIPEHKSIMPFEVWTALAKQHLAIVAPYADAFLQRRAVAHKNPVHDFLFTYYNFSPSKLKQWVPPLGVKLELGPIVEEAYPWFNNYWFQTNDHIISHNIDRMPESTRKLADWIATLCINILDRPARFGCFGLHEWAMVYKLSQEEIRHQGYTLRLSSNDLATFVESQALCCSHYDAYRFFTPQASPLNTLNPRLETRLQMEQAGCLHTNMDLYKWSTKLWPWVGSGLITKAFLLALEGRELDMRASPYDLKEHGYLPICIETEEGRKTYQKEQLRLAEKSIPIRNELLAFCQNLA